MNDFWCFDTEKSKWEEVKFVSVAKRPHVSGGFSFAWKKRIYIYGGVNQSGEQNKLIQGKQTLLPNKTLTLSSSVQLGKGGVQGH